LAFLNDLNNIVAVKLFKATDKSIHGQSSIAGTYDPIGQQRKTGIHITAKLLHQIPLISYVNMTV